MAAGTQLTRALESAATPLSLSTRAWAAGYATEIDVTVRVPRLDIHAESRRSASQPHLDAAEVFARIELKLANVRALYAADELIVLLLLFARCPRRSRG